MAETEKKIGNVFSPLEEEGVRGDGTPRWYVVHTYSGHENKVKNNIEKIVKNNGMEDKILEIVVPTENVIELRNGKRVTKQKKMFPGYVIIKMIVNNETWYLVRNTQGVTGFVGHGSEPIPLTAEEVARMHIEKSEIVLNVSEGDLVRIISGPFKGFSGEVVEVDPAKEVLKAKIEMFGRDTKVELGFDQVDKF